MDAFFKGVHMGRVLFDFFSTWSDELAWWLGVLLGDGNVHIGTNSTYKVSLAGDLSTTTRWAALFAPDSVPQEFKRSPGTYQVHTYNKQLVEMLGEKYRLGGPKSASLPWPRRLPLKHRKAFLRGLWDTDGSLFIDMREGRRGGPACIAKYASMDGEFVQRLQRTLREEVWRLNEVAVTNGKNGWGSWYEFKYSSRPAWKVASYLYQDAPEHLRNERRYEVFLRMQELRGEEYILLEQKERERTRRLKEVWPEQGSDTPSDRKVCSQCGRVGVKARGLCDPCYKREWRKRRKQSQPQKPKAARKPSKWKLPPHCVPIQEA